jgi:hypothetical protein
MSNLLRNICNNPARTFCARLTKFQPYNYLGPISLKANYYFNVV